MIPTEDIRLPDGRRLRYKGPWKNSPYAVEGAEFRDSVGVVLVTRDRYPDRHETIHVSISHRDGSYAEEAEVEAVRKIFRPDGKTIVRRGVVKPVVHLFDEHTGQELDRVFGAAS